MADEKDRLGQTLRNVEAAREDQWARQHDAELLEQLRKKSSESLNCPKCGKTLEEKSTRRVKVFACPESHGAWVESSILRSIFPDTV